MTPFKKIGEESVYEGSFFNLVDAEFEGPGGRRFQRQILHHPGAVVVVPMIDESTVLLVRQYRVAIEADMLELPAGKRDVPGEEPEVTAGRELAEEVGRVAGHMELLTRFYNSAGLSDELTWIYLARDLTVVPENRQGIEEEAMTLEEVRLADVERLIADGEITDAKTIIGLLLTLRRLG